MADNKQETVYADRDEQDRELVRAVTDILSAEEEAKGIIARAEAVVKAAELDCANRERDMRENSAKTMAAAHDEAINAARKRAADDSLRKLEAADKAGAELVASKQKQIEAVAAELYKSLGDIV